MFVKYDVVVLYCISAYSWSSLKNKTAEFNNDQEKESIICVSHSLIV